MRNLSGITAAALRLPSTTNQLEGGDAVAEREQHPVPVQPDEPEAGLVRPLVRSPPLAAPRMNGIVLGLGALLGIIAVLAMPPVEVGEPCGRLCLSSNKFACRHRLI